MIVAEISNKETRPPGTTVKNPNIPPYRWIIIASLGVHNLLPDASETASEISWSHIIAASLIIAATKIWPTSSVVFDSGERALDVSLVLSVLLGTDICTDETAVGKGASVRTLGGRGDVLDEPSGHLSNVGPLWSREICRARSLIPPLSIVVSRSNILM